MTSFSYFAIWKDFIRNLLGHPLLLEITFYILFFLQINRFLRWLIESEEGDIFLTALIIIPMIIAVMILIFTQVDNIYVILDGMRRIFEQRLLGRCEERIIKEWHIINYIRKYISKKHKLDSFFDYTQSVPTSSGRQKISNLHEIRTLFRREMCNLY